MRHVSPQGDLVLRRVAADIQCCIPWSRCMSLLLADFLKKSVDGRRGRLLRRLSARKHTYNRPPRTRKSSEQVIITRVVITMPPTRKMRNCSVCGPAYIPNGCSIRPIKSAPINTWICVVGRPDISSTQAMSAMMGTYSAKCACARIALRSSEFPSSPKATRFRWRRRAIARLSVAFGPSPLTNRLTPSR